VNRVIIDLEALRHNLGVIDGWVSEHGATWTVVTKALCGQPDTLGALWAMGVRSMGDSRLLNVQAIQAVVPAEELETWYLRVPSLASVVDVVSLTEVSLNSEMTVIKALNQEAARQGKRHWIVLMIELGDLREGILPGSLIRFYEQVFDLSHLEVLGIGSNLGCISGQVPTVDQYMQLVLYHELLELKFKHKLPVISAGSSVTLPMLLDRHLPRGINHLRIGESVFLGNNLVAKGPLPGLRSDVMTLEADIVEIKEKNLVPLGIGSDVAPFPLADASSPPSPGQRGYRALVNIGQLDTDVGGLTPQDPTYQIAGASSDLTVVNVGDHPGELKVGGAIRFGMNYAAMLRLMSGAYVPKVVEPALAEFRAALPETRPLATPHVMRAGAEASPAAR